MEYNSKNPAIKRIMKEVRDMRANPSPSYMAHPLEENLFDWHFTILGPSETDFEGGRYHGRIILPSEYPFKPPSIILLTPNGRFQLHTKICLSITGYHPEFWQPAWSVATVLQALISFFPTPAEGAVGGLDTPSVTRRQLAKKSLQWVCTDCGGHDGECAKGTVSLGSINFPTPPLPNQTEGGDPNTLTKSEPQLSEADREFLALVNFTPEKPNSGAKPSSSTKAEATDTTSTASTPDLLEQILPDEPPTPVSNTPTQPPSPPAPATNHPQPTATAPAPSTFSVGTIDALIVITLSVIIYLVLRK